MRSRTVRLAERVPPRYRKLTLYFVTVPRGGVHPEILPRPLPKDAVLFALEAASIEDVARLSRKLNRPVTLAAPAFARAMGVRCRDARVTIADDGRRAVVTEAAP